jgi:hypothetical protein
MAGNSGGSFPFTAITVVLMFLSTSYLGQHAYNLWRQDDGDVAKRPQLSEQTVEARLWEDPLTALNRHREKLKGICPPAGSQAGTLSGATLSDVRSRDPRCQPVGSETFKAAFPHDGDRLTVIAVLLPGTALVGAEEGRRRARYALLAGLNAEGYVPDDSDHMGLLQVNLCGSFTECDTTPIVFRKRLAKAAEVLFGTTTAMPLGATKRSVIYETLHTREINRGKQRHAAIFWIDDEAAGRRWLSALTTLLGELAPDPQTRLRILGPSQSDALVDAVGYDLGELQSEAATTDSAERRHFRRNWQTLLKLRVISPTSTAPAEQVLAASHVDGGCSDFGPPSIPVVRGTDCVDDAFRSQFYRIWETFNRGHAADGPLAFPTSPLQSPFFVRTVGTDDLLIRRLAEELRNRGLGFCTGESKRVVLISEWDSIYARTFAGGLQRELTCADNASKVVLHRYSYLDGLDGVSVDGAATPAQPDSDKAHGGDHKAPPVEWPEGRAQEDYIRRLVQEIQKDNYRNPVHAIGMIGSDVHDKLILVQALRDAFPDRVLFTTDMDARLLHPSVTPYTRNVLVATSLSNELSDDATTVVGPFRDSYQTAMFLAARHALAIDDVPVCTDANKQGLGCRIEQAVANPKLFEIGRDSAVELANKGVPDTEQAKRQTFALVIAALLFAFAVLMLIGKPAPAMRSVLAWWSAKPRPFDHSHAAIAGFEAMALGYAAGVVVELAAAGSAGASGPFLLAAGTGAFLWTFAYPGTPWAQALRPVIAKTATGSARRRRWLLVLAQFLLLCAVVSIFWWQFAFQRADMEMHEPFAPLSGASAWPSQLLRTLAVVLFAWFLDRTWCGAAGAARDIEERYFPGAAKNCAAGVANITRSGRSTLAERIFAGLRDATIWFWTPDVKLPGHRVDGARLWHEYRALMDDGTRLVRIVLWLAVSFVLIIVTTTMVSSLTDGPPSDIPARGVTDRALFSSTLVLSVVAVVVLLVLVGDMTILTWRFVAMLQCGRTVYPTTTIAHFAAELGPALRKRAAELLAATPGERDPARDDLVGPPCRNSLLDDWIDARLLAQQTAKVGPLIFFPFILVALMIVARSRMFDNWDVGGPVLIILAGYVLWSIAMAALLNLGAEQARRKAVDGMQADLLWLQGAGPDYKDLADCFSTLIEQVRTLRKGAFAPFFEQPLVQAILVPLGGAGGIQLLDLVLYARAQ